MVCWKFNVYSGSSSGPQADIDRLSSWATEQFVARIRYLAETAKHDWNRPQAAKLKGYDDLYEIRFKANDVQVRPLGTFGPGPLDFTIVLWATKKGDDYKPRAALDTASKRCKQVREGKAAIAPLAIAGEDFSQD